MLKRIILFLLCCAMLTAVTSVSAQVIPDVSLGVTPNTSTLGGQFDTINLATNTIMFDIPVLKKTGLIPFEYHITGNLGPYTSPTNTTPSERWLSATLLNGSLAGSAGYAFSASATCPDGVTATHVLSGFYYKDPRGTTHNFPSTLLVDGKGCKYPTFATAVSTDGTGYTIALHVTGGTPSVLFEVYDKSGVSLMLGTNSFAIPAIIDTNGNEIQQTTTGGFPNTTYTYTDTMGLTALTETQNFVAGYANTFTYTYFDGAGVARTVTENIDRTAKAYTDEGCGFSTGAAFSSVSSVNLPDGTSFYFSWEAASAAGQALGFTTNGRLHSVTLPSGATITYTYTGMTCNGDYSGPARITRVITEVGGRQSTWTYDLGVNSNTVTDPLGNQTVYNFSNAITTQVQTYQGTIAPANLVRTKFYCYNNNFTNCPTATVTLPIVKKDEYTTVPGVAGPGSLVETLFDTYGNPTSVLAFDYDLTHKSYEVLTYGSWNGSGCGGFTGYIHNRVCRDSAWTDTDGAFPTKDELFAFDGSGNLVSHSASVGPRYLTSSYVRNANGTVQQATDVNGNTTTFTYGDCNGTMLTNIAVLSMNTSKTWACNGGVVTSETDANSQVTYTAYVSGSTADPFWRPLSLTDEAGNVTTLTYTTNSAESAMVFGSSIKGGLHTVDSLNRQHVVQIPKSTSKANWDTVEVDYDPLDRVVRQTDPYNATARGQENATVSAATSTYDPIGRALLITKSTGATVTNTYNGKDTLTVLGPAPTGEVVKQRQYEHDAFGRVLSVCEITSAAGSAPCGQATAATGFLTTYAYDVVLNVGWRTTITQHGSGTAQTRVIVKDFSGRLVSESSPEAGLVSYTYDTDPTCGTSNGDLVKKVDNAGNVTCYQYDPLHRPTQITYPSGPNSAITKARFMVYDAPYANPQSNLKGRLSAAGTCQTNTSCAGSPVVATEFSYSVRGEISDVYQTSPHRTTTTHAASTYLANGIVGSLSGLPSIPTITYGVNGQGELNSVSASVGQNPVTSTSYSQFATPTFVNFGSGDQDSFVFPHGLMGQYQTTVNGQIIKGVLTRNTNDSVNKVVITDPVNTANAQTCTFKYDEFKRVSSDNCGAGWSQTFAYDPFGNITKSGSVSYAPGYNQANNRANGVTYDSNGKVLSNGTDTFTWNAYGKAATINGVAVAYDGFARPVESGTTVFMYGPDGRRVAQLSSSALIQATVRLPGGAEAVYGSAGTLSFIRHADWLGSSRLSTSPTRTVTSDVAYGAFGEGYDKTGSQDLKFAGNLPDLNANQFTTDNRQYSASQGRWYSPDPAGMTAASIGNPQTFNQYAYASNFPSGAVDTTGLWQHTPTPDPITTWENIDTSWIEGARKKGPGKERFPGDRKGRRHPECAAGSKCYMSNADFDRLQHYGTLVVLATGVTVEVLSVAGWFEVPQTFEALSTELDAAAIETGAPIDTVAVGPMTEAETNAVKGYYEQLENSGAANFGPDAVMDTAFDKLGQTATSGNLQQLFEGAGIGPMQYSGELANGVTQDLMRLVNTVIIKNAGN